MFLYNFAGIFKKFLICYLAEQFISVFSDPVHISRYIFACIVHCTDDLLQIHAGTAFFHKCLTNGIFNLYEDLVKPAPSVRSSWLL